MAKTPQVKLTITTDYLYTADFLRQLASEIENSGPVLILNTSSRHGQAKIKWPKEASEDMEE